MPTFEGIDQWHTLIVSLLGRVRHQEAGGSPDALNAAADLDEWVPVVRTRARSRGPGAAHVRWETSGTNEVHHVSGHQEEYLFYRTPLRGNFTVECDVGVSGTTQFFAAGQFFGAKHIPDQLETGTFRGGAQIREFAPPFSNMRDWMRCRAVFDNGTLTIYLNGRSVHQEQLAEHHDPWIGVRSWWRNDGRFRDVRIAGTPDVTDTVVMSASPKLIGWLPYHDDEAGYNGAHWQWHVGESVPDSQPDRDAPADINTGEIIGAHDPRLAGSFRESLLRYHRPLEATGSVEYEFFYEPGKTLTHLALDRLAFILGPDGVRIHWITDATWDRTPVSPDNLIDEPHNRRGPTPLPLNAGAWNQLKLSLRDGVAQIELNDEPVFERPVEHGDAGQLRMPE